MELLQLPPDAKPVAKLPYGVISSAFVGAVVSGKKGVWYAYARNGFGPTYLFPVLEDGTVSCFGGTVFAPETIMHIFEPTDLGIEVLTWSESRLQH